VIVPPYVDEALPEVVRVAVPREIVEPPNVFDIDETVSSKSFRSNVALLSTTSAVELLNRSAAPSRNVPALTVVTPV
jgi:hypothetical protein